MTDHTDLVRQLNFVADDLDDRWYPFVGPLREAARRLTTLDQPDPDGCHGCGQPLDQPDTGRPRKWCNEACRSRTRRNT